MRFGDLQLSYMPGSLVETPTTVTKFNHYAATNISRRIDLGNTATIISCVIIAKDAGTRLALWQAFHSGQEAELHIDEGHYYKQVYISGVPTRKIKGGMAQIDVEFKALDPRPYSILSGGPLY